MFEGAQFIWGVDVAEVAVEAHPIAVDGVKITSVQDGSLVIEVGHHTVHVGILKGAAVGLPSYPESYGIHSPAAA